MAEVGGRHARGGQVALEMNTKEGLTWEAVLVNVQMFIRREYNHSLAGRVGHERLRMSGGE